jgi:UDP-N-acetylglucosamine 2-epimerase (non-hydrolysing)
MVTTARPREAELLVTVVVGARPNFMKAAPVIEALRRREGVSTQLVHTGQHYDRGLSRVFIEELGLPEPDVHLGVGSGSHAEQTAAAMVGLERFLRENRPDMLLVVGDVNSTLAGAVTAAKLGVPLAHVEAGLRSFDRTMPEEVNRVVTDSLSGLLFTTEESANANLRREGHPEGSIRFVGNTMIDTLLRHRKKAASIDARREAGLGAGEYALMTLHRPSNVDARGPLSEIVAAVRELALEIAVLFPAHPRTAKMLARFGLDEELCAADGVVLTEPLGYLSFLSLMRGAGMVLTDSGGMQEETTFLGVPCLTLRENTERPATVEQGTSTLVGHDRGRILAAARRVLDGTWRRGTVPPLWDGRAAERIADALVP